MSSFHRQTRHPDTGEWESAAWHDDYFGSHRYGVEFPSQPGVFYEAETMVPQLETRSYRPTNRYEAYDKDGNPTPAAPAPSDDYAHRDDPTLDRAEAKIIQDSYPGVSMSDGTFNAARCDDGIMDNAKPHAPAPTGNFWSCPHISYNVAKCPHCPAAPAPAAEETFIDNVGDYANYSSIQEFHDTLRRNLIQYRAAARAEERDRVWRLAEKASRELSRLFSGNLAWKVNQSVTEAALADGVDLTSLAKTE